MNISTEAFKFQLVKTKTNTVRHMFTTTADSVKTPQPTNGSLEKKEDMDAENHVDFVEDIECQGP